MNGMNSNGIVISFLGDISLNDKYIEYAEKNIDPFHKISPILKKSCYVVGNLEAMSEGNDGENLLKTPRLKTNMKALNFLKNLRVNLVTLANNHVFDNQLDGFKKTLDFLDENSVNYIGAALRTGDLNKIHQEKIKGHQIVFLNYVHPDTNPSLPENCPIKINEYKPDEIVKDIISAKKRADYVFLLIHWGMDNSYYPAPWQRKEAKIFIEAGADFIIGHHTHTMQGFEKIVKGYVFYSLGNFCFSEFTHNEQKYELDEKRHTHSFILNIEISENAGFKIIPIFLNDGLVTPGNNQVYKKFTKLSRTLPIVNREPFWTLYWFYLSFVYKIYFFFRGNGRSPIQRIKTINYRKLKRFFNIIKNLHKK